MTRVVRVDPDGSLTRCEGRDLIHVAERGLRDLGLPGYRGPTQFGMVDYPHPTIDVVSCTPHPFAPFPASVTVIAVHEWGHHLGLRPNYKAWSLYGRSPLLGPAWIADDAGGALHDDWIFMMSGDPWWISRETMERMQAVLAGMGVTP